MLAGSNLLLAIEKGFLLKVGILCISAFYSVIVINVGCNDMVQNHYTDSEEKKCYLYSLKH